MGFFIFPTSPHSLFTDKMRQMQPHQCLFKSIANGSAVDVRIRISQPEQPAKIHLPRTSEEALKNSHTASHVMAMAVQKLFPKAQVTIGPWLKTGFTTTLTIQSHLQKDESHEEMR